MTARIGIRREDKSKWERRVPIIPKHARKLHAESNIDVWIQPSEIRVYPDQTYRDAGAHLSEDLSPCPVVFAVKEIPKDLFEPGHTYVFFAHVIKGQAHNMEMLKALLDRGCQLIDYEKVTDARGRRLIFFGHQAGLAGMMDTLCALGRRLDWEGIGNAFSELQPTYAYNDLRHAKQAVARVGERIAEHGLPASISPLICGFAGYGHVYGGAREIVEMLPVEEIQPAQVAEVAMESTVRDRVYTVVFKEEDTVEPNDPDGAFELQDYYDHPDKYRSRFADYIPHLTALVNCVYWEEKYPRLVTKEDIRRLYRRPDQPRLRVIGDISCDIEGAIEPTVKCTEPGEPVFVYDPFSDQALPGVAGSGPVILAVDILPSELPQEASEYFSDVLMDYVPAIAEADYSVPLGNLALPPEIRRALIVYQGELTPDYRYLREHLP